MRRLGICLTAAAVAGAIALFGAGVLQPAELVGHQPPAEASQHYLNMEGAAESAFKNAAEWYGLPVPAAYQRDESEGAKCPSHVPARKGQLFWCQALLEGHVVGVEGELTSSLGFFKVLKVAENSALWAQIEEPENYFSYCSAEGCSTGDY